MGLVVTLQDEFGEVLEKIQDRKDLLGPYIPPLTDQSYHCLRFIDRYGDAYFNRLQMETFASEWERLMQNIGESNAAIEKEVKNLFSQVRELARKCDTEPHLYLKFSGD